MVGRKPGLAGEANIKQRFQLTPLIWQLTCQATCADCNLRQVECTCDVTPVRRVVDTDAEPSFSKVSYDYLVDKILGGAWMPGDEVNLRAIAAQLGISRAPV